MLTHAEEEQVLGSLTDEYVQRSTGLPISNSAILLIS